MAKPAAILICFALGFLTPTMAFAAELKVFASRGVWTILTSIGPEFEKITGHKLFVETDFNAEFIRRINSGEEYDIIITDTGTIDELRNEGKVLAGSPVEIARSSHGVIVRAGASKPDIRSIDSFKNALLRARSITYPPGPAIQQLIEKLGIKDAVASKVALPTKDVSAALVAKGEVELGIVAATQALTTPGVDFVGLLPAEAQIVTDVVAAISATSNRALAAKTLLVYLKTPKVQDTIKAQGMEPL